MSPAANLQPAPASLRLPLPPVEGLDLVQLEFLLATAAPFGSDRQKSEASPQASFFESLWILILMPIAGLPYTVLQASRSPDDAPVVFLITFSVFRLDFAYSRGIARSEFILSLFGIFSGPSFGAAAFSVEPIWGVAMRVVWLINGVFGSCLVDFSLRRRSIIRWIQFGWDSGSDDLHLQFHTLRLWPLSCLSVRPPGLTNMFTEADLKDACERSELSLLARIFWDESRDLRYVKNSFIPVWKCDRVRIFDVGYGLYQFIFPSVSKRNFVLAKQPWYYQKAIVHFTDDILPKNCLMLSVLCLFG
ncbi:hypothetical protein LINPERHAP2_LOCUS25255 [Linum perenne]